MSAAVSLDTVIKNIVQTGQIVIGSRETIKLLKLGKVKAVIYASNIPKSLEDDLKYYSKFSNVMLIKYPGSNRELGAAIGKPFSVLMMGIIDAGRVPLEILQSFVAQEVS